MTEQSRLNIEKLFQEARHYSNLGEITLMGDTFKEIRKHDSSLATEEQLLVLMREGYRNCMKDCLTFAAKALENWALKRTTVLLKLDKAKSYALQLNGRDAKYFLLNAPQIYEELEKLTSARA